MNQDVGECIQNPKFYTSSAAIHYKGGGGEGGGTKKNLMLGGPAPRSDPLPFYAPFLAENIPLVCAFH